MKKYTLSFLNKKISVVCCLFIFITTACSDATATKEPNSPVTTITGQKILEYARILSSREYRGREAGSGNARRSGIFIAQEFRKLGLLPGGNAGSFFRTYKIMPGYKVSSSLEITIGQKKYDEFKRWQDYAPIHLPEQKANLNASCVLVGYGVSAPDFDEYQGVDVKGKIVIVFSGVPRVNENLYQKKYGTLDYKVKNAEEHQALGVFIVSNPAGWRKKLDINERLKVPDMEFPLKSKIPVVHITQEIFAQIALMSLPELRSLALDIVREKKSQSIEFDSRRIEFKSSISGSAWIGRNIIGILPGNDPKLRREAIVIGAHYDHLGENYDDEIFFGANDNAAGVGVVISIAAAFSALENKPKRSIVFVAFDAEEIGRVGSAKYVNNPPIGVDNTVLMINFDMIGRNDPNHIFAVGTLSSPELHEIHRKVNEKVGLNVENPESFRLGRSDHTAFYYSGIPIMYLFGGKDPDYHRVTDTWEKLLPGKMEKVAKLAFLTAYEVAEKKERITFHK